MKTQKCEGSIKHGFFPWNSTWKRQRRFLLWGATCPFPWTCCSSSHHKQWDGDGSAKQGWRPAEHLLSRYLKVACYAEDFVLDSGDVLGWWHLMTCPVQPGICQKLPRRRGTQPFLRMWVCLGITCSSSSSSDVIHSVANQSISNCSMKEVGVIRSVCFSSSMRRLLSLENNRGKCLFIFSKQNNKKWQKMLVLSKWEGWREQLNCSVRKNKYLVQYAEPRSWRANFFINLKLGVKKWICFYSLRAGCYS